jgi:N-acetylmuramoyl-L-alanine amidase
MSKVYLAVGHGRRPNGGFDPGAVAPDGTREYDVARRIVSAAEPLIESRGVEVVSEVEGHGPTMDPNYVGSVREVNGRGFDLAVSAHLDWHKAPRGGFVLYVSNAGKAAADKVAASWGRAGLPQRANSRRTDLYFLNETDCPAVIVECDRVGADVAPSEYVARMAEALAEGVCDALGVEWSQPEPERRDEEPPQTAEDALGRIKDLLGIRVGSRWDPADYEAIVDRVKELA